jgi:predicted enzyme related to lactoylglutathione lyase
MTQSTANQHFQGLRTVIYAAPDLEKAKAWYSSILGIAPYFDQPFYVGFNVGGYELGLDPDSSSAPGGSGGGAVVYWGVADAGSALERLLSLGATARTSVQEVGEGIKVATVLDPFGNVFGVIENPHFKLAN